MSRDALDIVAALVGDRLNDGRGDVLVVGLCGAQGSGKSFLSAGLARRFAAQGVTSAILSLDDLYLPRAERAELARSVHPMLATRGVPGTHDVALGCRIIDSVRAGRATVLPRFDKGCDDRLPPERWDVSPPDLKLLVLEGWCVGAAPEDEAALNEPVNELERVQDADGAWRRYVNRALAGPYRALFARLDLLVMLAAPSFDVVAGWRQEQERALRRSGGGGMSDAEVAGFVAHYERLTRAMLAEMPARADLVLDLDRERRVLAARTGLVRS